MTTESEADLEGTISWAELAVEVADYLRGPPLDLHSDLADQQARFIVMRACGAEAEEWPSMSSNLATKRGVAAIDAMTRRRLDGEPLQYVLGEWSFRYLDLFIDRRVLIPRPETELVAGAAIDEVGRLVATDDQPVARVKVADLGTGSGAIGLAIASENTGADVWLTDVSRDALAVARANIASIGRAGSRVTVVEGSWFGALPNELRGDFGVIVANPPYIADHETLSEDVIAWEPTGALFAGPLGTEDIDHLIDGAPAWLTAAGALVLEMAPEQTSAAAAAAEAAFAEVRIDRDLAGLDRIVVARHPIR
ncbi:MAG: peptide chain release factor N(5)-glutamine methyltransferase [Acidimicrobiales bacterium]